MTFVSYAQNCEDVLLWRALRAVEHGCYIDIGAGDPDEDNVTRAFYGVGWRGVNVEPMPPFAAQLRLKRPGDVNLSVAVGAEPSERMLYQVWTQSDEAGQKRATGLSTLDPVLARWAADSGWAVCQASVDATTLASICRDHIRGPIHFLKIDAEGSEREILLGADWNTFRPWILVIEAISPESRMPNHSEWESLLIEAEYCFVWFDGLNRFYVAAEHMGNLSQHFRVPINSFDEFVRYDSAMTSYLTEIRSALTAEETKTTGLGKQLAQTTGERDYATTINENLSGEFSQLTAKYEQKISDILQCSSNYEQQLVITKVEAAAASQELARLRVEFAALHDGYVASISQLERLAFELRWEQAPRALKVMLPFARVIRRLYSSVRREQEHAAVTRTTTPMTASSSADMLGGTLSTIRPLRYSPDDLATGAVPQSWRRRFALLAYRPFRLIIRPLVWRLRTFMTAELRRDLHELHELHELRNAQPVIKDSSAVDLKAFGEVADRLLLTLALEHRGEMDKARGRST